MTGEIRVPHSCEARVGDGSALSGLTGPRFFLGLDRVTIPSRRRFPANVPHPTGVPEDGAPAPVTRHPADE